MEPLLHLSAREFTHVCMDCGALGVAGGYHDHGGGNAGDTIALKDLPSAIRDFQRCEVECDALGEEIEHLRKGLRQIVQWATYGYQDLNSGGVLAHVRKHAELTLDEPDGGS